jgi:hypothetical protein
VARRQRGIVERLALVVMGLGVGWLLLNAVLGQLQKSETDTFASGGELLVFLEAGEERAVYLRQGARTDVGLPVGPGDLTCVLEPPDDSIEAPEPERVRAVRLLDGWNRYDQVVVFEAPAAGSYTLRCADDPALVLVPGTPPVNTSLGVPTSMRGGAEVHVADPVSGEPAWVSPGDALVVAFIVVALAGLVWTITGVFRKPAV